VLSRLRSVRLGVGVALELALELQVEFAAFGDELAFDVIAFFEFA